MSKMFFPSRSTSPVKSPAKKLRDQPVYQTGQRDFAASAASAKQHAAHRHVESQNGIRGKKYAAYQSENQKQSAEYSDGDQVFNGKPFFFDKLLIHSTFSFMFFRLIDFMPVVCYNLVRVS